MTDKGYSSHVRYCVMEDQKPEDERKLANK